MSYNVGTQADVFVPNAAPINVVAGDLNGDGRLDLVVVHTADSSVNVLMNNGGGTFLPAVRYAVSGGPIGDAFLGDFNGDGKPDIAVPGGGTASNNFTTHAIILLNQGNGTFGSPIASSSFGPSRGWAVGDFNGDGKLDLVSTDPTAGQVNVLLGNGDGTFQPRITSPQLFLYSRWVTAGDFNGDGKADLAIADGIGTDNQTGTAELTILLGNGDGTFRLSGHTPSPPTPGEGTVNPEDVFATDLNGDGKLDVIETDYDHNINVFLGNGDGTVRPAIGVDTGQYPRSVAVADVNGDGKKDLVVTNVGINVGGAEFADEGVQPGSVAVLLGNGDGTFQGPVQYMPFAFPGWTAVGDFNGDGRPDLAVTRVYDGHSVNVMLNQPGVSNPPTLAAPAAAHPLLVSGTTTRLSVLGADDGGEANLTYTWATTGSVPGPVTFSANGTNAAKTTTATFSRAGTYAFLVTTRDADGLQFISSVTVIVPQQLSAVGSGPGAASQVKVYRPDGVLAFSLAPYAAGFTGGVRVATADVTGDGVEDIIVAPGAGGGPNVEVFDGSTQKLVRSFMAFDAGFTGGVWVAAGDVDGDGHADIIVGAGPGGGPHVKVFSGATGALIRSFFAYAPSFAGGVRVAAGDVTGDGQADIITAAGPGGGPHVEVFDGATGQVVRSFFAYDAGFTGGVFVAAGDVDSDGRAEIITGAGAGGGPQVNVYSGLDGTLLHSFMAYDAGFRGGVSVAAGDLNGDLKADLITGAGPGGGPEVRGFRGSDLTVLSDVMAYDPTFTGGVFVG